ncbi:Uncharacterised protein [Mycobacteroides abscessus subsp. abscessus]|uniref:hypothetical protein n=1 Tax=Mycobacteroides abscessus TaxID=36809 RepID=UPI000925B284|nr:hypothetical protein [Mycobacteroides abscessus]SHZ99847.1 Uncharacterised protein [Mycobacteroides abscessus subsp. abscessus]SIA00382.1 Uncharacterised protein [Mycobacteroides abscessus subsp. abscessus]
MTGRRITPAILKALTGVRITPAIAKALTGGMITPAILKALASIEYDEDAQHERAMHAMSLVRDDIADGRTPDQRLITTALACACRPCLDGMVEQAEELGRWLTEVSPPSPVERFVQECCERTPGTASGVTPAEFHAAYVRWAGANGESVNVSAIKLGRELSARLGIRSKSAQSVRIYEGLAIQQRAANGATRAQSVPSAQSRAQVGAQIAGAATAADTRSSERIDEVGIC